MDIAERHLRHRIRMLRALRIIVVQKQEVIDQTNKYGEFGLSMETALIKSYVKAIQAAIGGLDHSWVTIDANLRRQGWRV